MKTLLDWLLSMAYGFTQINWLHILRNLAIGMDLSCGLVIGFFILVFIFKSWPILWEKQNSWFALMIILTALVLIPLYLPIILLWIVIDLLALLLGINKIED